MTNNKKSSRNIFNQYQFYLAKKNRRLIYAGVALMALGYVLMIGGKSTDPNFFNADEIFSFQRITLSPIIIVVGIVVISIGIIKKFPEKKSKN